MTQRSNWKKDRKIKFLNKEVTFSSLGNIARAGVSAGGQEINTGNVVDYSIQVPVVEIPTDYIAYYIASSVIINPDQTPPNIDVVLWPDQSQYGRNLETKGGTGTVTSTGSWGPMNNQAIVRIQQNTHFTGTFGAFPVDAQGYTIITVAAPSSSVGSADRRFVAFQSASYVNPSLAIFDRTRVNFEVQTSSGEVLGPVGEGNNEPVVIIAQNGALDRPVFPTLYVNGSGAAWISGSYSILPVLDFSSLKLVLGGVGISGIATNYAEIRIYPRELTQAERQLFYSYYENLYGITPIAQD